MGYTMIGLIKIKLQFIYTSKPNIHTTSQKLFHFQLRF